MTILYSNDYNSWPTLVSRYMLGR